jgi:phage tail-like protein
VLEVDGVEIGVFTEVSGLHFTVQVEEVVEGGQNQFAHRLPGRITWPNLVFRRGLTDSDALAQWVSKSAGDAFAANGNAVTRCTGAVTAVDSMGGRLRSWEFDAMLPVRWQGPQFNVASNDPLTEELEVAHHGFRAKTLDSGGGR